MRCLITLVETLCVMALVSTSNVTTSFRPPTSGRRTWPPKNVHHEKKMFRNESLAGHVLDKLFEHSNAYVRPNVYGPPVVVAVDFFVQSIGPLSEVDMHFDLEIYFHMKWVDKRMKVEGVPGPVIVRDGLMDRFWIPDVYFPNAKNADFHRVLQPNKHTLVFPNGTVMYSSRLTMRVACPMSLKHYPLDYQECWLKLSSYAYDINELTLEWSSDDPIQVNPKNSLPQFFLLSMDALNCTESYKTGEFPCLVAAFHFKRSVGYYVLQGYMPSILIIIIAWLSFWIHRDAVPARITLGVTTVLTMTTQLGASRSSTVKVSYPKALDVWYSFCMVLVFGALMEYAFVNVLDRREKKQKKLQMQRKMSQQQQLGELDSPKSTPVKENRPDDSVIDIEMEPINNSGCSNDSSNDRRKFRNFRCQSTWQGISTRLRRLPRSLQQQLVEHHFSTAHGVDRFARVFYPVIFVAFNLFYWTFYAPPSFLFNHMNAE